MAATRRQVRFSPSAGDYPNAVVFDESDGIYWVERKDYRRLQTTVERSAVRVGFDREGFAAEAVMLISRGVRVGLRRGDSVRMLSLPTHRRRESVASTSLFLEPAMLVERAELVRLEASVERPHCRLRSLFEHWRACLSRGEDNSVAVYVYKLSGGMYEVDWERTEVSESSLLCLALAAQLGNVRLHCRLVSPGRPRRDAKADRRQQPVIYRQLGFGF